MEIHSLDPETRDWTELFPFWFRLCSFVLLALALALLLFAFRTRFDDLTSFAIGISLVLPALGLASALHIRSLLQQQKHHRNTETAFRVRESEFTSVFEHALDGILILNDQAVCLDANPAALALVAAPRHKLVGCSFGQFQANDWQFAQNWQAFLRQNVQRGEMELRGVDGGTRFVYYTAAANFLPGRHVWILCDTTERINAQNSLRESEHRFAHMATKIAEVFWVMDATTKEIRYVSPAYERITGRSIESLYANRSSYVDLIHVNDRSRVLAKLDQATQSGQFDEEFRILRPDGATRWVAVKAFPDHDSAGIVRWLAGTAQDITARKIDETRIAAHLAAAEAARAEAEALRKATLALTQNLRMDAVLDTVLECLLEIVPYDSASVILTESDGRLFVAREAPPSAAQPTITTFAAAENVFLQRALVERKSTLLADTRGNSDWRDIQSPLKIGSWLCVPLVTSGNVVGILSLGKTIPGSFTTEHFRLTKSLAVPAAVAIHNARLYEWTEIYAEERRALLRHQEPEPRETKLGGH